MSGERTFTWEYCRPVNVVDGDTIDVEIDTGFHTHHTERIRLYGINCPEMRGGTAETKAAGQAAKQFTIDQLAAWMPLSPLPAGWPLRIVTYKTDDFGRYLGDVYPANQPGALSLSSLLLQYGHAVVYLP